MMRRSAKVSVSLRHEYSPTVATIEPVMSARQVPLSTRLPHGSVDAWVLNDGVAAVRIGPARNTAEPRAACMREVLLAASSCLLVPLFSNPVPMVSCNLPAESWFERDAMGLLCDVAELLGAQRSRLKFEVPYTFLSRTASVVPEILASAGFDSVPLWIQLDRQTPPLIGELLRFQPALIIAPDDLADGLRNSAAAREDLLYFHGLAAAVGCPLLVPMVDGAEQMDCIARMGGNLVAGAWPSSALNAQRTAVDGKRRLH